MNAQSIDVSVVIVTWNSKEYLLQCLKSLHSQGENLRTEIVVVDNASSDGTATEVMKEFPNVRLLQNSENVGFARANNLGITGIRGKYLCLVNPDVIVHERCLDALTFYMDRHQEAGLIGPRIVGANGNIQRSCMRFPSLVNQFLRALALDTLLENHSLYSGFLMGDFRHDVTCNVEIINGCFWMVRRSALENVGMLDERFFMYGEDMDWCRRFWQHGWKIVFCPVASITHYGGGSSSNAPVRFYLEKYRANLDYWVKHHGRIESLAYRAICVLHEALRVVGYAALYVVRPRRKPEARFKLKRGLVSLGFLLGGGVQEGRERKT